MRLRLRGPGARDRRGDEGTESAHRGKHRDKGRQGTETRHRDKERQGTETRHRDKGRRGTASLTRGKAPETRHRRQGSIIGESRFVIQVGGLGHSVDEKYLSKILNYSL